MLDRVGVGDRFPATSAWRPHPPSQARPASKIRLTLNMMIVFFVGIHFSD
jgi:hypothetical protein